MDHSIHDVMNSLVAADAARMSGRDFADARGAGLARKVRTRRTVRAAGMGGASAVAVGALAFGAMHFPGRETMTPGVWPGGCTPTAVADIGAIWNVPAVPRAHVIDVSEGKDDGAWYLYDDNLEMVVLQMVPAAAGLEVTFADGSRELVMPRDAAPYVFAAPGGGYVTFDPTNSVHHAIWNLQAPADPSLTEVLPEVTPPFAFQWTGCGFGSSSAAPDPSLAANPSPSTAYTAPGPIVALEIQPSSSVWLTAGTELVQLYGPSAKGGLVTLRRSQGYEQFRLDEYTVPVAGGIARVRVGDKVVRVKVDANGTLTVTAVESAGSTAPLGEPTATAIDPWFFMGEPIDLDALVGW